VILDDFRSGDIPFNRLLRYLDRYPVGVPVKGGRVPFNPRLIVITCPRVPRDEFVRHADDGNVVFEDVEQIYRRCTVKVWAHDSWCVC